LSLDHSSPFKFLIVGKGQVVLFDVVSNREESAAKKSNKGCCSCENDSHCKENYGLRLIIAQVIGEVINKWLFNQFFSLLETMDHIFHKLNRGMRYVH